MRDEEKFDLKILAAARAAIDASHGHANELDAPERERRVAIYAGQVLSARTDCRLAARVGRSPRVPFATHPVRRWRCSRSPLRWMSRHCEGKVPTDVHEIGLTMLMLHDYRRPSCREAPVRHGLFRRNLRYLFANGHVQPLYGKLDRACYKFHTVKYFTLLEISRRWRIRRRNL